MDDFSVVVVAEPSAEIEFDIVFIHGLGGDPRDTWQADSPTGKHFWPKWIADTFPRARVLLLGYPTSRFGELFGGTTMSFMTASAGAVDALRSSDVGIRPVVFIMHSLGGVVAKAFLRACEQSTDGSLRRIYDETVGMVFFGTPHTGSSFASIGKAIPQVASMQTMEIARADAILLELSTWFKGHTPPHVRAFYETVPMGPMVVVDAGSADPGVPGCDPIPITGDHVSMCKFDTKESSPFRSVLSFLRGDCGLGKYEQVEPEDLDYYLVSIDAERRSLDDKLAAGGRDQDILFATREKERVAKSIQRNILFQSAKSHYKRVLGEINSRFHLHIRPLIESGASKAEVNQAIGDHVISPIVDRASEGAPLSTYDDVHAAIYYLTGNCHIDWSAK